MHCQKSLRVKKIASTYCQTASKQPADEYSHTLNLPVTSFPMRANAKENEASWIFNDFYQWQRKKNNGPSFIIHDGPPYANGSLHIGHALNKVLKDIMLRYKAMRGFKVHFIPGWDCHGLPIELKALENLKKKGGAEMLKAKNPIMIRELAKECALEQIEIQKAQFRSWGVMGDWDKHYKTMDATYEARQIEIFYDMFKKGLIYRGLKPVYWSPSSVTALAEAELEYNDEHVSLSVYVKIKTTADSIGTGSYPNLHFLIWTTTPWTLPSNKAIAISRNLEYCILKFEGSHLIVGKDRVAHVEQMLNKGPLEIVVTLVGSDLTALEYHPPFANEVYPVFHGAHVTAESGTGIVHTAPSHGMDDYNVCLENGLMEFLAPVDDYGKFTAGAGERLTGKAVLGDGNLEVVKMLEESGALLAKANFTHKYPYDWRTKKPIIVRATWQWFCGLKKIRDKSINALNKVNFFPKSAQSRLVSMVQSRNDWCISRQRSWGMPVPVFYKISNGEPLVDVLTISHIRSIFARYGSDCWWTMTMLELMPPAYKHRYQEYRIGQDTLDVWFDSGCSWYSVVEGSGVGQADMYLEGSDQHRGWFQSSLLTSVAFHRRAPYRNLVTHGFVLDEHGRKMSKSLGNVIDMDALIKGGTINKKAFEGYGVDAFRFWVASTNYTSDITIAPSNIEDAAMHIKKLRNTARFLLGNLAEFDQDVALEFEDLLDIDKYMLNQLYHFAETITEGYETIAFAKVVQSLLVFANVDLSAFYFDVTKDRLYTSPKHSQARRSARFVMNQILRVLMQAMAPILCHMTENVYQHTGSYNAEDLDLKSIFQLGWFRTDDKWKNKERESRWTQWRQLKHDFHIKVDELVRVESSVKKSTDVDLVIQTSRDSDFYRTCVAPYNSEGLAGVLEIFIASRCTVQVTDDAAHTSPVLVVTPAQGLKCPRCWKKVRREDNLFCDKELCPT